MTYEGLNRHRYGCKCISHDIYSCLDLAQEEREKKIKEFRELDASASQAHTYQALAGLGGGTTRAVHQVTRDHGPPTVKPISVPQRGGVGGGGFLVNPEMVSDKRNQTPIGLQKPFRTVMALQRRWIVEERRGRCELHGTTKILPCGTA